MIRTVFTLIISLVAATASAGSLSVQGSSLSAVEITPEAASMLSGVYIVHNFSGVNMIYTPTSSSPSDVTVERYGMRGAAYPTAVDESSISRDASTVTLTDITEDSGYIFTEGSRSTYFWVSSYSASPFTIDALSAESLQTYCDRFILTPSGAAPRMLYYGIDGRAFTIDRHISLSYYTLVEDSGEEVGYHSKLITEDLPYIDGDINIDAPLCDTRFTLVGDRFLNQWGMEREITSSIATCRAIAVATSAIQLKEPGQSELRPAEALGGSAPVEVRFEAAITDAVAYTRWQMARDPEFNDVTFYSSDLEFSYTFTEAGQHYVMFEAADATGECTAQSDIYTISIGESSLRCPNAFSPGASEGINDEWRVSYQSIVEFDCFIFNRWGQKMAELHDPSLGWDGRHGGKLVPPGVYYYVIKAVGADGKKYDLSGDINILGSDAK